MSSVTDNSLCLLPENAIRYSNLRVTCWVSEKHSKPAEIRLYDRLFHLANPALEDNFIDALNPNSLETLTTCRVEASLADAKPESRFQFERTGYFCVDYILLHLE